MPEEGTCPHHADFRSFLAEIEARLELQIAAQTPEDQELATALR
jgi:hypothetical protein